MLAADPVREAAAVGDASLRDRTVTVDDRVEALAVGPRSHRRDPAAVDTNGHRRPATNLDCGEHHSCPVHDRGEPIATNRRGPLLFRNLVTFRLRLCTRKDYP